MRHNLIAPAIPAVLTNRGSLALVASCLIGSLVFAAHGQQDTPQRLSTMARVFVRRFDFEGNTVFSSNQLSAVVASYAGREVTSEELQEARRAITLYYVHHGYINSGAVIPDQDVRDGVITVHIVEGKLTHIELSGNRWLSGDYLQERLKLGAGSPLNMNGLRDELQLLLQNANIQQLNAELQPGALPGESRLVVHMVDQQPFRLGLQADNARPPSVGAEEILLLTGDRNVTGHGDALDLSYGITHNGADGFVFTKLDDISGSYVLPVTAHETTLRVYGSKNDYTIIEEPFKPVGITSSSDSYGVSLRQPLYHTATRELAVALTFDRRESQAHDVSGQPFPLPGAIDGKTEISVVRLVQEWTDRNQSRVLALRSTFSLGIDLYDTTTNAQFWVWLGQFQYVQRLFNTANQLVLRTDAQWTDQSLASLEQFALGGAGNVRGYRENELVRDRGVYSGIELRVPVLANKAGAPVVQLAPFFDFGGAWDVHGGTPEPTTISSAGIGLLVTPNKYLRAQLYWGHPFRKAETPGGNLQDSGIHFQVNFEAF